MNLTEIKLLCQKYKIKPNRQSGQNFLIDDSILRQAVDFADLNQKDVVLEVGPGLGFLTKALAKKAGKVIAVEVDKKLTIALQEILKDYNNVKIINKDILKIKDLNFKYNKIVANLPYNITSIFLRRFLEIGADSNVFTLGREKKSSASMTLMLQKEVAERICAKPGKMSLLAVSVQFYAEPKIMANVSKESFWPKPKIDSAIIKIEPTAKYLKKLENISEKDFFRIVKFGFSVRRKQLQNNLAAGLNYERSTIKKILQELKINPLVRAQELSIAQWIALGQKIMKILKP